MQFRQAPFLVGLIGAGIQASRSPLLHEQEARTLGLRYSYQLLDLEKLGGGVELLPRLLEAAQLLGFAGLNITHPCKQAVLPWLDELSTEAAAIGAVNTVVFTNGKRVGYNTDWYGFAESFKRGLPDAPLKKVILLGAGGAGAAMAFAVLRLGAGQIIIQDLNRNAAAQLAQKMCIEFGPECAVLVEDLEQALLRADGVLQATPLGMIGHPGSPLAATTLHAGLWLAEAIYFPLETALLSAARAAGCRTLDGGGMAVFQAAEALRLFTGVAPDVGRMLTHFAQFR